MAQIQGKFVTKDGKYSIADTPYALPGTATSKELNTIINSVLKNDSIKEIQDVEFDFLVVGELLRLPLQEHLESKGSSTEISLEIEYFVRYPSPSPEKSLSHDDWVSCVRIAENWVLSGCYDDTLHLWNLNGVHKLTIPGHMGPVTAVAWIYKSYPMSAFVSTSHDQTAMVWQWNQKTNSVDCVHVCRGHARTVNCVDVNENEHKFATGSYDQSLKIWSSDLIQESESSSDQKRFKTSSDEKSKIKTPLMTLVGHTESISGVQWTDSNEICTCSIDNTIRLWDIELGGLKSQLNGSKAFLNISYSNMSKLLITASADRHARLWDPRSKDGTLVKSVFTSHNGWLTSVKWSPNDEYQFVSGSHDQFVKMWDTRSPKAPLYDMSGHEDKVLAVDWSVQNYIASGGSDNFVKLYRIKGNAAVTEIN